MLELPSCPVVIFVLYSQGSSVSGPFFFSSKLQGSEQKMNNNPTQQRRQSNMRLPPEVNRALFVRNLPFKITAEEMYDIFGKYGPIRQIRLGDKQETRGTAFVVYEDIYDAKSAVDHLGGFNVCGRYLIVLYYQPVKMKARMDSEKQRKELEELKTKFGLNKET